MVTFFTFTYQKRNMVNFCENIFAIKEKKNISCQTTLSLHSPTHSEVFVSTCTLNGQVLKQIWTFQNFRKLEQFKIIKLKSKAIFFCGLEFCFFLHSSFYEHKWYSTHFYRCPCNLVQW